MMGREREMRETEEARALYIDLQGTFFQVLINEVALILNKACATKAMPALHTHQAIKDEDENNKFDEHDE